MYKRQFIDNADIINTHNYFTSYSEFFMVENDKVVMFTILSLMLSNIITIFIFFKFQVSQSIKLKLKEEEKKKEELKKQILLYKQY